MSEVIDIPDMFLEETRGPVVVRNVGELRGALSKLPDDLALMYDKVTLTVFNSSSFGKYLLFEETE